MTSLPLFLIIFIKRWEISTNTILALFEAIKWSQPREDIVICRFSDAIHQVIRIKKLSSDMIASTESNK